MITIRKIAQEIIRIESGGDQSNDSQLSEAYIILMVRQAANKLLAPLIYARYNEDDRTGIEMMIATYEVNVQGTIPNKYIDLPEFYISLPFNKGIRGISPIEDRTNEFIPRHNPAVTRSLPCADLEKGQHSYFTEGLKVYFDGNFDSKKVLLKLVVAAPDSIPVDDPLPIYPEMQSDIISMVRQMLLNQPIQDKILDNNKDVGVKIPR